jgi:asparagine synthase (glutamine-hydrolysing)
MCGIFLFTKNNNLNLNGKVFLQNLKHRGPDFQKIYRDNDVEIGHTLLSIRDTIDNSIQPVITENGRYVISFNGQIYNLKEIINKFNLPKDILLDTTIISILCNKLGVNFIHEIDGMFALIIYDKVDKKIISVRDNTGQKPLYYYFDNKNFILSSEIDPILKSIKKEIVVDLDFNAHLRFMVSIGEKTIYKNIFKFLPGQKIEFDLTDNKLSKSFFNHNFVKKEVNLEDLLSKTIKDHLQTNQKLIINLSGGIDSNIILHEAIKSKKIEALSTRFETNEEKYNEDFFTAKKVCQDNGVKFHENFISKKDFIDNFVKTFETIEDINGNINNPAYFLTYKFIKQNNFRTVLSGDGGDEIFVGYSWFFLNNFKLFKYFPLVKEFFYNNSKFLKSHFYFIKQFNRYDSLTNLRNYFDEEAIVSRYLYINKFANQLEEFKKINFPSQNNSLEISNLLHTQFFWLSDEIFNRADKLAMHHSIESRAPLADYNLRLNTMNKLTKKNFYTKDNKTIVRNIYNNKLDPNVFKTKKGWTVPRDWILDKKFLDIILDIIPNKEIYNIKWNKIRNDLYKKNNLIMMRSLYPIISLAIILNKNNLFK